MTFTDSKWDLPIVELHKLVQHAEGKLKAILINSPHNPTGYQIPVEVFEEIMKVAKDNDAWVLSDEVYRLLEPAGEVLVA
jgi:aspartate/methionine/tyrosine aminotransferase